MKRMLLFCFLFCSAWASAMASEEISMSEATFDHPKISYLNFLWFDALADDATLHFIAGINDLEAWKKMSFISFGLATKCSGRNEWIVTGKVIKSQLPTLLDQPFLISIEIEKKCYLIQ